MPNNNDNKKVQSALAALAYIETQLEKHPIPPNELILGIGTGSTANCFIDALADKKEIFAGTVASSEASAQRLKSHGIAVFDLNDITSMKFYVDGADEIDPSLNMIKGGGGALTREKIVASVAEIFICIADDSKEVEILGGFPLPVEVIPMAQASVRRYLEKLGGKVELRQGFTTDNGNIILDTHGLKIADPLALENELNNVPGVVCNGIFAHQKATIALLAGDSGVKTL